jgi:hypothetical protein
MPTLTDEIKTFIVMSLARYETPSEVAKAVKANFAVELTRQHVHNYDPACSNPPALRWRELHAATRQAFLQCTAEIGIAHKAYRLHLLDRMVHSVLAGNYYERAAAFLEQAAKECGGLYDRGRRGDIERAITAPAGSVPENPSAAVPASR